MKAGVCAPNAPRRPRDSTKTGVRSSAFGRGLRLLVIWRHQDQDQELEVEAWAGEPETSEGIAVIDMGESDPLD